MVVVNFFRNGRPLIRRSYNHDCFIFLRSLSIFLVELREPSFRFYFFRDNNIKRSLETINSKFLNKSFYLFYCFYGIYFVYIFYSDLEYFPGIGVLKKIFLKMSKLNSISLWKFLSSVWMFLPCLKKYLFNFTRKREVEKACKSEMLE